MLMILTVAKVFEVKCLYLCKKRSIKDAYKGVNGFCSAFKDSTL